MAILLGWAVCRVTPYALDGIHHFTKWYHWAALGFSVVFMGGIEGYKGFQKSFSPRVVARALHLGANPRPWWIVFAPFFCLAYFHANRRRIIARYILTATIVLLIVGMRYTPQPWRGIVDAGVALGLSWGLVAMLVFAVIAFSGRPFSYPADLPSDP